MTKDKKEHDAHLGVSIQSVKDSDSPVSRFLYLREVKLLIAWWTSKKQKGEVPYAYVGVAPGDYDRLIEINVSKEFKERAAKTPGVTHVQSVGTYFNTRVKKYPTINLRKTTADDLIAEAKRISKDVPTRSTKKIDQPVPSVNEPTSTGEEVSVKKSPEKGAKRSTSMRDAFNKAYEGKSGTKSKAKKPKIPGIGDARDGDITDPMISGNRR